MIMGEKIKLPVDYTKLSPKIRKKVREKYCKLQDWLCLYCNHDLHDDPPPTITEKKNKFQYISIWIFKMANTSTTQS